MSRSLRFRLESFRRDKNAKVCLLGHAALHGFMVGVHAGVVIDLQGRRRQGFCKLVYIALATETAWPEVKTGEP